MKIASKPVKIDWKILSLLLWSKSVKHTVCWRQILSSSKRCYGNLFFDSGNAVHREAFTHTPLKKWIEKVVKKPNHLLPNVLKFLALGQKVFGFLYAHYTNKINKQKVVNKPNCLFLNVIFVYIRTNNIFLSYLSVQDTFSGSKHLLVIVIGCLPLSWNRSNTGLAFQWRVKETSQSNVTCPCHSTWRKKPLWGKIIQNKDPAFSIHFRYYTFKNEIRISIKWPLWARPKV